MKKIIPVLQPLSDNTDIKELRETLNSGWWGKGPKVDLLEKKFAKLVGCKFAVALSSNTAGLDLVLKAIGVKEKDEIISPTMSFVTTAVVPIWNKCKSVIVDVENNMNISIKDIEKKLSRKTKAVIAVNYAGIQSDVKKIKKIYKGIVIEDCAWSCYTKTAGKYSDVAIWSFQAVKTISSGDGGIITTNDYNLYKKVKELSFFCIDKDTYKRASSSRMKKNLKSKYKWDFNVRGIGYKYYMNDLQASLILSQLKKLDKYLNKRRNIQKIYNQDLPDIFIRPQWSDTCAFYSTRLIKASLRNKLMTFLADNNIHTTVHYKPLHLHKVFNQDHSLPFADKEWKKLISLPCHPALTYKDIERVLQTIQKFYKLI